MSLSRARFLIRLNCLNAPRIPLRSFSSTSRTFNEADDIIKKMLNEVQRQQRLKPSEMPEDSEWNVLKDLQSLHGPHLDQFLHNFLEKTKGEELEFEMLASKLSEAIALWEGKEPPTIEGVKADKRKEKKSNAQEEDPTDKKLVDLKAASVDEASSGMSPAERVMDLLDRAVVAGQPLLQRIIHAEDKDLDQLLAELDADEALEKQGLPTMKRPLVQSPNTLNLDMLTRKTGLSPTRALLRGGAPEGEWDVDGEDDVKKLMEQWMKEGEQSRTQGKGRLWNRRQRRQMAQMLDQAKNEAAALQEDSVVLDPGEAEVDTARIRELTKPEPTYLQDEKWFTTTPSIGLTQPKTHPRTHSIPVALLHFRSHHHHLLTFQTHFVLHSAHMLGIPVSHPVHLPTQRTLITVLKSPFVHKKSMENWERRTYKRAVKVWDCRPDVLAGWLAYLERNGVAGVGMRITQWEWADLDKLEGAEEGTVPESSVDLGTLPSADPVAPSAQLSASQ